MTHLGIQQISQKLLGGRNDVKSVANMWTRMWALYKAVRRRQEHTGGGDGDQETGPEDDGDDGEDEDGDEASEKTKKRKKAKTKERFTKSVMDTFESSMFFQVLDDV